MNTANYESSHPSVLVENAAGVLSPGIPALHPEGVQHRVPGWWAPLTTRSMSRITIEVGDDQQIGQITNQLRKQSTVHLCGCPADSIRRELVLIKVSRVLPERANEVIRSPTSSGPPLLMYPPSTLTLAIIGEESKDNALKSSVKEFGILVVHRHGGVGTGQSHH